QQEEIFTGKCMAIAMYHATENMSIKEKVFLEKFSVKRGLVITKNLFEEKNVEGKNILFVPAWLFLLVG
ncbi:MAG: hypothetical protein J4473_03465, partial [Candidatus Aenigmarchaeota archaeon]|nr:hypothetical protein [Candidatus Aenigmarchaeota archaeon]